MSNIKTPEDTAGIQSAQKTATNLDKPLNHNVITNHKQSNDRQIVLQLFKELISIVNKSKEYTNQAAFREVAELQQLKNNKNYKPNLKTNKDQSFKKNKSRAQRRLKDSEDSIHRIQSRKINQHEPHYPDLRYNLKKQILDNYSVIMQYQIVQNQSE